MKNLKIVLVVAVSLFLIPIANAYEVFATFGTVSKIHHEYQSMEMNTQNPGSGVEYNVPFTKESSWYMTIFSHGMAKDAFELPAYFMGAGVFYRYNITGGLNLDMGATYIYNKKYAVDWEYSPENLVYVDTLTITPLEYFTPSPYLSLNYRFDEDSFIQGVGFNFTHIPKSKDEAKGSAVTYLNFKLMF